MVKNMKLRKKSIILFSVVFLGSIFIGMTAVQGKVQIIPFYSVGLWDFNGFDPGTTVETGNWAAHILDNVNSWNFVEGPIDGAVGSTNIITNFNNKVVKGSGIAFLEIVGTWIADDEFNGLPIYCYGNAILKLANGGAAYVGKVNLRGALGDYSIQLRGDFIIGYSPVYNWGTNTITGDIKIIS